MESVFLKNVARQRSERTPAQGMPRSMVATAACMRHATVGNAASDANVVYLDARQEPQNKTEAKRGWWVCWRRWCCRWRT
jgi:hypothetical protein